MGSGGKIDLSNYSIINKNQLVGDKAVFKYTISLSDELTNEVVRKFLSYLSRGGISASEISEAEYYSAVI
ncbi:hypothetical protein EON65_25480 [archaeon]|nr:MAG: hypothetical protein EON65_25480 [archaeon]